MNEEQTSFNTVEDAETLIKELQQENKQLKENSKKDADIEHRLRVENLQLKEVIDEIRRLKYNEVGLGIHDINKILSKLGDKK